MRHIQTDKAPAAVGTYSQGVELNGTFFFSGMLGLDPITMELSDNIDDQITQIMKNIDGILGSQDLTKTNIVKTTIFLTDLGDFGKVNSAYETYFSQPYPARSCVEVSALPKSAKVEIEVIAAR